MLTLTADPPPAGSAPPPLRITADQFAADAEAGRFPPDRKVELLDGLVVLRDARDSYQDEVTIMGPEHIRTVVRARKLLEPLVEAAGGVYREEKTVLLPPHDGPQPDGAIVRGPVERYDDRYPVAEDILLLLEVADSSYRNERTTKVRIYAETGVPVYWLIHLPTRTLEVRSAPDPAAATYQSLVTLAAADTATLPLPGGDVSLPLADLLG
ncbi:Uma2 family endonuclease [Alienimonas sp. DA493]|uniref:Uma2 family endonuclease n=1 Tax=Alienimonas sp. DA493 TaxID=3373605 RepID=UPI003755252A